MGSFSNDQNGLILTLASSVACVLGSFVIFADVVWRFFFPASRFELSSNDRFLVSSLALSSGTLLFTAFYRLLPSGLAYFRQSAALADSPKAAQAALLAAFFSGVAVCAVINAVIHALTSQSIVHCAHDHSHGDDASAGLLPGGHAHGDQDHTHDHSHAHFGGGADRADGFHNYDTFGHRADAADGHSHVHTHDHGDHGDHEHSAHSPLLKSPASRPGAAAFSRRASLLDISDWKLRKKQSIGKCMGYAPVQHTGAGAGQRCSVDADVRDIYDIVDPETGVHWHEHVSGRRCSGATQCSHCDAHDAHVRSVHAAASIAEDPEAEAAAAEEDDGDEEIHHHHISTRYSHLFSIGLQTAFAIAVHKIPEGFLTFATSHANKDLGLTVFLSLAIHNVAEGFTIAFPLYLALGSRTVAVAAAFVLGGLSQPLGALLAWLLLHDAAPVLDSRSNLVFGTIVGVTAGFLSIIGFQMYGTAVSFGGNQRLTMFSAFAGIAFIGFGYTLTAK